MEEAQGMERSLLYGVTALGAVFHVETAWLPDRHDVNPLLPRPVVRTMTWPAPRGDIRRQRPRHPAHAYGTRDVSAAPSFVGTSGAALALPSCTRSPSRPPGVTMRYTVL